MNTKVEQSKGTSAGSKGTSIGPKGPNVGSKGTSVGTKGTSVGDIGKLTLAALILIGGVFAYTWFSNSASVTPMVRVVGVIAAVLIALAIAAFTALGRRVRNFLAESQFEMRKVVWPTRDETLKTTGIILVVVFILSLLLGLIDLILKSVILDWLLKL